MNNVSGCVEVNLGVFGGNNLDMDPSDLPAGLSWGNKDCAFLPGSVFTRPSLERLSTVGASVVYATTFLKPDGSVSQLIFTSDGGMYADGVKVGQTHAGNRFFTCNAFGKMFIATSDGSYGTDVPLQYTPEGWLDRVSQDGPAAPPTVSTFIIPATNLIAASRVQNEVTATTDAPHLLNLGYQVAISGAPASQVGGSIVSVVISNEDSPGLATITTSQPHYLKPQNQVNLLDISNTLVGEVILSLIILSNQTTVTTETAHGLTKGSGVLVTETGGVPFYATVTAVPTSNSFTYAQTAADSTSTAGGTVVLLWPDPNTSTTTDFYTVQSCPTATTFTVAINYPDGNWSGGSVSFGWNGTFPVTSIISPTEFTYNHVGPDLTLEGGGTVTPQGQSGPGQHNVVVIFETRTGYLTIPSPPVQFTSPGNQYIQVSNIPIGPPNVIARWLAFTGANGGNYFILPVPPRDPTGLYAIGTATAINDNSTTSAVFDFSDESLFAGIAIDIPGNNLFRQQVLGPCLGFFSYASRLIAWGERNKVQNLVNMGFEGGVYASAPNVPLGWTVTGTDGSLVQGDYGLGWQATNATLSQTAYQDINGISIIQPNTLYTFRMWVTGTAVITLSSASTGFTATARIAESQAFGESIFSSPTPATISSDLLLTIGTNGIVATVDEMEIFPTLNPRILTAKASYVNNPEAFDGVTGIIGEANDPHPVWGMEERKDVLCFLTNGPEGSLYETEDTASGEPVTWSNRHTSSKCGLVSVWGVANFEDWFCWTADTGLRIFDGSSVDKMSQEIQPRWDSINPLAKQLTVLSNDPYTRRIYLLTAQGTSASTNATDVLDYRDLNTAGTLASAGALHVSMYSGKVITTDLTRKWSTWSISANYCGLLTLPTGEGVMTFCAGNSVYTLLEGQISGIDQDFGPFTSFYPTYFFLSADDAQQKSLGVHRLQHDFMTLNVSGVGQVQVTPYINRTDAPGRASRALSVTESLARDLEIALNVKAERVSYMIAAQPVPATGPVGPAGFRLSSLTLAVKTDPFSPIRGRNG